MSLIEGQDRRGGGRTGAIDLFDKRIANREVLGLATGSCRDINQEA